MNSTIESPVTSVIMTLGGILVYYGVITQNDLSQFYASMTAVFGAVMFLVPFVRKIYNSTMGAKIKAINSADNGVKVVDAATPAPTVNAPLK